MCPVQNHILFVQPNCEFFLFSLNSLHPRVIITILSDWLSFISFAIQKRGADIFHTKYAYLSKGLPVKNISIFFSDGEKKTIFDFQQEINEIVRIRTEVVQIKC